MMKYVERVLQPGETVRFVSHIHWLVFFPGAVIVVLGIAAALALDGYNPLPNEAPNLPSLAVLAIGVVFGVISLVGAWFRRMTVEVAATDRRIIFKHGFIRRHTIEMNMNKVESVDVDQSVLGRLFDYGSITVRGTGSTLEPLRMISAPLQFRSHVIAGEHA
jgi:membrane protein YdbS with pleckstrin-like domain